MARRTRTAALLALWRALRGATRPGEAGLGESVRALPRLVLATLTGRYPGLKRAELGLWALSVLYVLSPVDLVPELLVPLLGFADDLVVATWVAGRVVLRTGEFLRWEREHDLATSRVVAGRVVRG